MTSVHIKRARVLARLLDNQFRIGKFSFGLDPILGLFPGAGDLIPAFLSFYLLWIAILHKLPRGKLAKMVWNIGLDYIVGSIPLLGDFFDFAIRPSTKNLEILEDHIDGILEGEIVS